MALLTLQNAHLAFGLAPLLNGADFAIETRERIGLIGRKILWHGRFSGRSRDAGAMLVAALVAMLIWAAAAPSAVGVKITLM